MLPRVALVRIDVSEERFAEIIRVTRISELGTLAVISNRRKLRSERRLLVTAKIPSSSILVTPMEALRSSETSVLTRAIWRNIPEDGIPQSHCREKLKSYMVSILFCGRCRMHKCSIALILSELRL
jgi:hypothetical protein